MSHEKGMRNTSACSLVLHHSGDGKGLEMGKDWRQGRPGDEASTEPLVSSVALTVSTAWLVATEAEVTKQLCCKIAYKQAGKDWFSWFRQTYHMDH